MLSIDTSSPSASYHEPRALSAGVNLASRGLAGDTALIHTGSAWPITLQDLVDRHEGIVLTMREAAVLAPQRPLAYVRSAPAQLYRLLTHTGRCVEGTPSLPLLTPRGWKPLFELEPLDTVATVAEYPELFGRGDTDGELLKLLAYLTRNGTNGDGVTPPIDDPEVQRDFEHALEAKGEQLVEVSDREGHGHVRVCARPGERSRTLSFLHLVGVLGICGSDKVLPDFVFGLRKDKLRLFLNRLLTCDGAAERSGRIRYRTTSVRLARQLQHLFARFGIVAALVEPGREVSGGAELSIDSKADVLTCIEQIGFLGDKADHAEWLRASLYDVADPGPRRARLGPILFDRVLSVEATRVAAAFALAMPRARNFIANELVIGSDPASSY